MYCCTSRTLLFADFLYGQVACGNSRLWHLNCSESKGVGLLLNSNKRRRLFKVECCWSKLRQNFLFLAWQLSYLLCLDSKNWHFAPLRDFQLPLLKADQVRIRTRHMEKWNVSSTVRSLWSCLLPGKRNCNHRNSRNNHSPSPDWELVPPGSCWKTIKQIKMLSGSKLKTTTKSTGTDAVSPTAAIFKIWLCVIQQYTDRERKKSCCLNLRIITVMYNRNYMGTMLHSFMFFSGRF